MSSSSFRVATPDEVARLETARRSLARSAAWARGLAFYVPGGIGVVVSASTLANYPGDLPVRILVGVLQLGALGCVFTLPILLSGTGRTLAIHRKLTRDAEAGFGIAREVGEVSWGKRQRGYVARVRGERLVSPFFTELVLPAFWDHFERLAPGAYVFELLPESRVVLTAEPVERAHLGPDGALDSGETSGRLALRVAFGNSEEDAQVNREGRASVSQRRRLLLGHWWAFVAPPALAVGLYVGASTGRSSSTGGAALGAMVALGVIAFLVVVIARVLWDVLEGRVDTVVGSVLIRHGKTDATGTIGTTRFTLSLAKARALQRGRSYRVFVFRHSRAVAGAEPTLDRRER